LCAVLGALTCVAFLLLPAALPGFEAGCEPLPGALGLV